MTVLNKEDWQKHEITSTSHHFITQYLSLKSTTVNEFLANDTNGSNRGDRTETNE